MLTKQHALARWDFRRGRIEPDRLMRTAHAQYVELAGQMLAIYRAGIGRTLRELHRAVFDLFRREPVAPQRRIAALYKLLDDASTLQDQPCAESVALRRSVFQMAAADYPLWKRQDTSWATEADAIKVRIAKQLGRAWADIERTIFSDIESCARLLMYHGLINPDARPMYHGLINPDARPRIHGISNEDAGGGAEAHALLSRYNVAQVQVALYGAERLTVWARRDFKTILVYAKLARLMHTIRRVAGDTYCFQFDGPASILRETRRYGVALARFLPALVACRDWRMHAVVRVGRRGARLALDLSSDDGLTSHLPAPEEFDSRVEAALAREWGTELRAGWRLEREGEVLHEGQKVFFPDFVLQHADGRRVLLEIVGFWTPEYLAAKCETIKRFRHHPILLAVAAHAQKSMPPMSIRPIVYRSRIRMESILERLAELQSESQLNSTAPAHNRENATR